MNPQIKQAERLHRLLADTEGLTNAELRRMLQAEGVDVNAYLERLKPAAPSAAVSTSIPFPQLAEAGHFEELPMAARQPQPKRNPRPPR
jgi:hypothetical protein